MSEVLKSVKSYCEKVRRNFCKHNLKPPDPLSRGTKDTEKYKTVRSKANLVIEVLMKEGGQVSAGSPLANAMSLEIVLHT